MSSRIADIVIQAKLETRKFQQELTQLRSMIEDTLGGVMDVVRFAEELRTEIEGSAQGVLATRKNTDDVVEGFQQATGEAEDLTDAVTDIGDETQTVVPTIRDGAKSLSEMKKEAERLSTQMRWVARDVMRVGFTAGLMGASFLKIIKDIGNASMDLMIIFNDISWLMEEIGVIIGKQMAPILEALIVPFEFIRDFLEANKAVALLAGILLILGAVFFSLASMIMFSIGMYGVLVFGMAMFTEEVKESGAAMDKTGSIFQVMKNFAVSMGRAMLGLGQAVTEAAEMNDRAVNRISSGWQMVLSKAQELALATEDMHEAFIGGPDTPRPELKQYMESAKLAKKAGLITKEEFKEMAHVFKSTASPLQNFKYNMRAGLTSVKEGFIGIGGSIKGASLGGAKKSIKGIAGSVAGAGKKMVKGAGYGIAMYASFLMMQEVMKSLEPILTVLGELFGALLAPLTPMIEMIAEFIENNTTLVAALIAVAVAVAMVAGASVPLMAIAMAILAVFYLLDKIMQKFGITLFGSGVHQALVMVTEAMKLLLAPASFAIKIFKKFSGVGKKAEKFMGKLVGGIRGLGAHIRNVIPEPIMELASAIKDHLPSPLDVLRGAFDILSGLWEFLSGDWKGGAAKIVAGVKTVLLELAKIPIMMVMIGYEILAKLWEGIKAFIPTLYKKIIGGSLVWDIVGWFATLPLELLKIGGQMLIKLLQGIKDKVTGFLGDDGIGGVVGSIIGGFLQLPIDLLNLGKDMITSLIDGVKEIWDLFGKGDIDGVILSILVMFAGIPMKLLQFGKNMIDKLREGITDKIGDILGDTALGKFLIDVTDWFADVAIKFFDFGVALIESLVNGIKQQGPNIVETIAKYLLPIAGYFPNSPAKKGPLRDVSAWGEGFTQEFDVGLSRGFNALGALDNLGNMSPVGGAAPPLGRGDVTLQNEFVIYATIQDKQDLLTLRDEISMKQLEQARRMRVLSGGV